MQFLTGKAMPRRQFVQSLSATIALPYLGAMVPRGRSIMGSANAAPRLIAIEMVHGAAGSNDIGSKLNFWSPAATGRDFDLSPSALSSLDKYREYMTIISNTDVREAEPAAPPEIGGDHFRSSATFLTQTHPKQTEGSDVKIATSLDQLYAQRFGQDTPIPSMQLCIENVDQAGGCSYGYALTPSAGSRPPSRCRSSAIRAWPSRSCSAWAVTAPSGPIAVARVAVFSTSCRGR